MASDLTRRPVADRFWSKVTGGDVSACWNWSGASNPRTGYGNFNIGDRRYVLPHRFAYEALRVDVPEGLQIDHLCRNRLCVNPWHMEPVTPSVNVRRSSNAAALNINRAVCRKGHPFTEENTYRSGAYRKCRACHLQRERTYRANRKGGAV